MAAKEKYYVVEGLMRPDGYSPCLVRAKTQAGALRTAAEHLGVHVASQEEMLAAAREGWSVIGDPGDPNNPQHAPESEGGE